MAQNNELDVQVEGWLKTLGIASLCQWDLLVFLDRHPSLLISAEHIPFFLGYSTGELVAALDILESSGMVDRSRDSKGVRLHRVIASADPARRDALERLMTTDNGYAVRLLLARRRRGAATDLTGT